MKQFLTICMAAAMLGTAVDANAGLQREKAMQLKSEGKGYSMPVRTRDSKALKTLKHASVSGFHKMVESKNAMQKAPAKVTPLGDEIYGYLGYADDYVAQPIGLYEFEGTAATMKWADPLFQSDMLNLMNAAKVDDTLVGYIIDQFWGMVFGIYFVQYDFESGDILDIQYQDLQNSPFGYIQTCAYNSDDETFYGYGAANEEAGFVKASLENPFEYEMIKPQEDGEFCMSMCYNPADQKIYGITGAYEFVEIDANTGVQTKVMDLDVPNGATYITGLCYDPKSSLFYWNINYADDTSAMATIDLATQTLNVYAELGNGEEYMSLICGDEYGVDPERPERPVAGAPEFYKNNLIGIVPFTMPTKTMGGDEIPADAVLTFKSYINGEYYNQGTAAPGEVVRESFSVPESGKYTFSMVVVYNGKESKSSKTSTWVGDDVPLSPTNVKMTSNEVSWDAVTGTVHNGYLELSALYYEVTVNGETQETANTSCSITLPEDQELAVYNAQVVAVCNGMRSAPAYSNNVPAGLGIAVPVEFAPSPDEFALCVQLDGNEDGKCWSLGSNSSDPENPYFAYTSYTNDPLEQMDDWLFLPKVTIPDVEKFYTFSMEVALRSNFYPDEYVEVLLCNEASPRGVVGVIIDEMSPEGIEYEKVSNLFRVRQAGDYYIAIHCTSDGDQLGIAARNFAIEDNNITLESPDAATDLRLTADPDRALKATVEFTMPSLTVGEVEIPADEMLTAVISTPAEQVRVKALPGKAVNKVVETLQGWNDVIVEISNNDNFNSPSLTGKVYTGWDVPSCVENLVGEASEDMTTLTLTWDPVTTGWLSEEEPTEGVINPETVTYDIYMLVQGLFGSTWEIYETGITEPKYVYDAKNEEQDQVYLGVVACNEAGNNGTLMYVGDIVGEIYELPIDEDFEGGMLYTSPWLIYRVEGEAEWGLYENADIAEGLPEGASLVAYADAGTITRLAIPRFTTVGVGEATLTLDILKLNMPVLSVYAEVYGQDEPELLHKFYKSELTDDITSLSFTLPAKYMNKTWVAVYLDAEFEGDGEMLAIENLTVDGGDAVKAVANENVRIAAGKGMIKVVGLNGQDVTVANASGAIVAKAAKATESATFNVEKGVYVVVAGDKKAKVIVK